MCSAHSYIEKSARVCSPARLRGAEKRHLGEREKEKDRVTDSRSSLRKYIRYIYNLRGAHVYGKIV